MLTPIIWKNLSISEQNRLLQRPVQTADDNLNAAVKKIINSVRNQGDTVLKEMAKQYDNTDLTHLQVDANDIANAYKKVSATTIKAIERAIKQLQTFHVLQKPLDIKIETAPGIICENQTRAIQRVGLYIPGGSAPLLSTVLMLGVPAQIAGCPVRVLCSPPRQAGNIDPHIIVAANLCGIEKIYKVGGAQAIAAMTYGTATIPKVDKIFGPGNRWVTQAKLLVAQDVAGAVYDLPAGPSEVMVIADKTANPEFVAADLLSQAEHDTDSQVILICTDLTVAQKVDKAINRQLYYLSRKTIAIKALSNSHLIFVDTLTEAIAIANDYAPEHLILQVEQPRQYVDAIQCAGSVFLGQWSPESGGDYASGTNHVLPTYGFAKAISGLTVRDFMKTISFQELTREGLTDIAETIIALAGIEGLDAHQNAVKIRITGENNYV